MNVDRRLQRLGPVPERVQRRVVEILAIGVAVDHRPAKLQLAQAALQFIRCSLRVLHGKMREAGIAVGTLLDLTRQKIVGLARPPARDRRIAFALHARSGDGKNGARNPGAIHRFQAHLAEVRQAREQVAGDRGIDGTGRGAPVTLELGTQEVLFERDLADHNSPGRCAGFVGGGFDGASFCTASRQSCIKPQTRRPIP